MLHSYSLVYVPLRTTRKCGIAQSRITPAAQTSMHSHVDATVAERLQQRAHEAACGQRGRHGHAAVCVRGVEHAGPRAERLRPPAAGGGVAAQTESAGDCGWGGCLWLPPGDALPPFNVQPDPAHGGVRGVRARRFQCATRETTARQYMRARTPADSHAVLDAVGAERVHQPVGLRSGVCSVLWERPCPRTTPSPHSGCGVPHSPCPAHGNMYTSCAHGPWHHGMTRHTMHDTAGYIPNHAGSSSQGSHHVCGTGAPEVGHAARGAGVKRAVAVPRAYDAERVPILRVLVTRERDCDGPGASTRTFTRHDASSELSGSEMSTPRVAAATAAQAAAKTARICTREIQGRLQHQRMDDQTALLVRLRPCGCHGLLSHTTRSHALDRTSPLRTHQQHTHHLKRAN